MKGTGLGIHGGPLLSPSPSGRCCLEKFAFGGLGTLGDASAPGRRASRQGGRRARGRGSSYGSWLELRLPGCPILRHSSGGGSGKPLASGWPPDAPRLQSLALRGVTRGGARGATRDATPAWSGSSSGGLGRNHAKALRCVRVVGRVPIVGGICGDTD